MGILEDFRSLFRDDFKAGVRDTSDKPVIFINPDEFDTELIEQNVKDGVTPVVGQKNIDIARAMLEEQLPGYEATLSDNQIQKIIAESLILRPRAVVVEHSGQQVCMINEPGNSLDHKNEIIPAVAGKVLEELGAIPGWDDHWDYAIGTHEGEHCNQDPIDLTQPAAQISASILQQELGSDRAALAWLRENGHADIAQALRDYRALAAAQDPEHATSIFLDSEGPVTVTPEHIAAARGSQDAMFAAVAADEGITPDEAKQLLVDDPEKFLGIVREQLADGTYEGESNSYTGGNPYMKAYIEDYVGAYQRQIVDPDPVPEHERHNGPQHHGRFGNGTASVVLTEGLEDTVEYITAAIALETVRAGDTLDSTTEQELRDILNDPDADPELMALFEDRYADVIFAYKDADVTSAPAPTTATPQVQSQQVYVPGGP